MKRLAAFAAMLVSVATMVTLVAAVAHAQPVMVILTLNTIDVSYPDPNSFGGRVGMEIQPSTGTSSSCSPVDPQGVVVDLTLPAGTTFVSATLPGTPGTGIFNGATNTVSWDFGTVDRFNGCSFEERRAEVIFDVNPSVLGGTILAATAMVSTTTPGDDPSDNQQVVMFQGGMLPLQVVLDEVESECDSGVSEKDNDDGSLTTCSDSSTGFLGATAVAVVGATGAPRPLGEISGSSEVIAPKMTVSASADGDFSCNPTLDFCFAISNSAEAFISMDIDVLNPNPFPVPIRFVHDAYLHASCGDDAAGFTSGAFIEDSVPSADCGGSDQTGSSEFHVDADGGTGICRVHGFENNRSDEPFDEEFSCAFLTVPQAGLSGPGERSFDRGFESGDAGGSSTVFFIDSTILIRTGYGQYNAAAQLRFGLGGGTTFSYTAAMHIVVHSLGAGLRIVLTDDQGRRVGFDARVPDPPILTSDSPSALDTTVNLGERTLAEIPGGRYSGIGSEPQEITVGLPEPGVYTLDLIGTGTGPLSVTGTGTGPFTVDITTADSDGNILSQESFGGDASPGVTTSQAITLAEDGTVTLDGMEPGPIPGDIDGDGVPDGEDECLNSDLGLTVVIDGCDSGVINHLFPNGCSISDEIAALAEGARNHGQFTRAVSHFANGLKRGGQISDRQKGALQRCAARAAVR